MRERPILFNGAMVRAILEGRKTVTRRPVKGLPLDWLQAGFTPDFTARGENALCPYGQPGDRLWVRETWAEADRPDGTPVVAYAAGGCTAVGRDGARGPDMLLRNFAWVETPHVDRWRPSIHMPRWACRLVLEITDVRVERLQAISDADCWAEGAAVQASPDSKAYLSPRGAFHALWGSTGGDWDSNPWVWVISFRPVDAPSAPGGGNG
jgi:hypothetical protein